MINTDGLLQTQDNGNYILKENGFDDDFDDDFDEEEYELGNEEINEYMEDIKYSTSDEYFDFVKYLICDKKFSFKQNSLVDGGYNVFATNNYEIKLYDGSIYKIVKNDNYFISTCSGLDLYVEGFYPNTFHYDKNGNVVFDKLYYTWQDSQILKYIDYDYTKETVSLPHKYDLRDYNYVT